eukprot:symbB.v1.2.033344.t1/scaffold4128.1/size44272/4
MGSASKNLALPAAFEACAGVYVILRAHSFRLKHDKDGTGMAIAGICMLIFAQSVMVFSADPPRVPKAALIAYKACLCVLSLYALVTTASLRSFPWISWCLFFIYALSSVPMCFMIYAAALHGKNTANTRLNELSASERAAIHG